MAVYDWIIGVGMMFGFALFITVLLRGGVKTFFAFLLIMNAFVVYGGFLELWTLVLNLIIISIIIFTSFKKRGAVV